MSQPAQEVINMEDRLRERMDTSAGGIPQSAQNQTSQGGSNFSDGSGPIFNMYVKMAEEEDKQWRNAGKRTLMGSSYSRIGRGVDPRPQTEFAGYRCILSREHLSALADPNITRTSILATPLQPPPFSPPNTQSCSGRADILTVLNHYDPAHTSERGFAHSLRMGSTSGTFPVVELLPTLLHTSLFLFFSGLLIYLFNINHTVFSLVVWWVGLSGGVYGCITLLPIFRLDSPYYAPLSSSVWAIYTGVPYGSSVFSSSLPFLPDHFSL
ncbi:hypothetical protein BGW80DRAFT_1567304 [Lactifluus volemus]|nr:hypothetical protein BGW80DRAFT_1567304 [Lactifluus volemus]